MALCWCPFHLDGKKLNPKRFECSSIHGVYIRGKSMSKTMNTKKTKLSDVVFFYLAGGFMLINAVALWGRSITGNQLSLMWAAIPAIIALSASVLGLIKLNPRISYKSPIFAKVALISARLSATALALAAVWILVNAVFGYDLAESRTQGFLILIFTFMVTKTAAYICSALAFFASKFSRRLASFLLVPVISWLTMLFVGITLNLEAGLSLDYYLNPVIAIAFLSIGFLLHSKGGNI